MVSEQRIKELKDINEIENLINKNIKEESESKELFSNENIETRTELNNEEISIISRLKFLCDHLELDNFKKSLVYFMELRLSLGRKSRKEFVDSVKKEHKMFGGFNGVGGFGGTNRNF